METRQKIPVPRRSFLWSLNETSGEILLHVGPTEFTPSANDRIVRASERGGFEQAPMEARPFVVARDGEYVVLTHPVRGDTTDEYPNGAYIPGGNKEKELGLGTNRVIPGPCSFPLWPGQSAEVRTAHKLSANHYLLVEVVGTVDERAPYYRLVMESAGLSSAVIDAGAESEDGGMRASRSSAPSQLLKGQRIVIQGRHTPLFIPPSGIEIVAPVEEVEAAVKNQSDTEAIANLAMPVQQELSKLVGQSQAGMSTRQFSTLKNELRHRQDLSLGERAVMLSALDSAYEDRGKTDERKRRGNTVDRRAPSAPMDPFARRAVLLNHKEFCVLFDADGNPRIVKGPARVFPGPHDTFMQRGSRRRVYDAYELAEHQALWIRIIAPIARERLAQHLPSGVVLDREAYEAGHELLVKGQPSVFFPFIEAEVIHPGTHEPHVGNDHEGVVLEAIGIDQKSGIYVRDLRTGMVKMVRGETSYLVDPRNEEHVRRRIPREQWNLWIAHAEPHKVTKDDAVTTPWAVSVSIPNNEAVLVTSRHGRRVEVGPRVVLLEFEETLSTLRLSKGPSKDGHTVVATAFLRVRGGRIADSFEIESNDFVRFRVKLGFAGHFEGEPLRWFEVEDPVKLLADTVRAKVREAARLVPATRLVNELPGLVRAALLSEARGLRFEENGMVVDNVDVLVSGVADTGLAELFSAVQREAVRLELNDQQATRKLVSSRHQDTVSAEENRLAREQARRSAETRVVEREQQHAVALRSQILGAELKADDVHRTQELLSRELDFELRTARDRSDAEAQRRLKEAEAEVKSAELGFKVEESHRAALSVIEQGQARAFAEAEALRLGALQPELVASLYAAADSEVLKAAANNMNLVALLGGRSPAEILGQIVRGTPLARSVDAMARRGQDPVTEAEPEDAEG